MVVLVQVALVAWEIVCLQSTTLFPCCFWFWLQLSQCWTHNEQQYKETGVYTQNTQNTELLTVVFYHGMDVSGGKRCQREYCVICHSMVLLAACISIANSKIHCGHWPSVVLETTRRRWLPVIATDLMLFTQSPEATWACRNALMVSEYGLYRKHFSKYTLLKIVQRAQSNYARTGVGGEGAEHRWLYIAMNFHAPRASASSSHFTLRKWDTLSIASLA